MEAQTDYRDSGLYDGSLMANSGLMKAIRLLSAFQVAVGCVSLATQGIFTGIILLHMQAELRHLLVSLGIWAGVIFILTGVIGCRLQKTHFVTSSMALPDGTKTARSPVLVPVFIAFSIVSALCAGTLFAVNIVNLMWFGQRPLLYFPTHVVRHSDIYLYQPLTMALLGIGVVEMILSIVTASLCGSIKLRQSFKAGRFGSLHRIRSFTDYPISTMGSHASDCNLPRRVRSYSQSSLVQPPVPTRSAAPQASSAPRRELSRLTLNFTTGPPPSYEDAWDGRDGGHNVSRLPSSRARAGDTGQRREQRSNARLYQNLQTSSHGSRASF